MIFRAPQEQIHKQNFLSSQQIRKLHSTVTLPVRHFTSPYKEVIKIVLYGYRCSYPGVKAAGA